MKHRVSKKDLKEDRFQEFVEKVAAFYFANPRRFWTGLGVGMLAIVGIIFVVQNRPKPVKNPEAELRLMDGMANLFQGNLDYAERALKELKEKFGREYAGVKAHYYLGNLYLRLEPPRLDEAKREFTAFLKKAKNDPLLVPGAMLGIATCEEQKGNYLKAGSIYEKVYKRYSQSVLGYEGMLGAGRCYRKAGRLDLAEKVYESYLKDKLPGTHEDVRLLLSYVQALRKKNKY